MQLTIFTSVLDAASKVLPDMAWGDDARVLLLAIAGQEGGWKYREQEGGPARSYWQLESEAVQACMKQPFFPDVCALLDVPPSDGAVYAVIAWHDVLAAWCARTLLWSDPAPLPAIGDIDGAWACYQRVWRPGKPGPDRWPGIYIQAAGALGLSVASKAPVA